ncbi:MAG: hypothetical protein J1F23_07470 [Oscillospiraceae bacterium]|nr:hypothetical protein [Oscillospiraceae bacterium]
MDGNNSLNKKYQKIDSGEAAEVKETAEKQSAENKKEKAPKEKKPKKEKIKVTKAPKPKKEKQPKAEKPPKEKKIKEEKPPKDKKPKKEKAPKEKKVKEKKRGKKEIFEEVPQTLNNDEIAEKAAEVIDDSVSAEVFKIADGIIENADETVTDGIPAEELFMEDEIQDVYSDGGENAVAENVTRLSDREEEIVFSFNNDSGKKDTKKEKKVKQPKEKKEKPPKAPKEKKEKAPKAPKEKKEKAPKAPKEKKPKEPMKAKDYLTIFIAVLAVALVSVFVGYKYIIERDDPADIPEPSTQEDRLANIQIARNGVMVNLIQSDIPDVFYGFSSGYELRYYQYRNEKMVAVSATNSINVNVALDNATLPVTIEYVELGDRIFGIGLFRSDQHPDIMFYDRVVFKLVNLPNAYKSNRKALLLVSTSSNAITQGDILWTESFTVDLDSGETSRFLSVVNRNMDMNGAGVSDFCILNREGYSSTVSNIPFITAREYPSGTGQQDIFVKNGTKETLFASDIYGKFLLTDGDAVIYMKRTELGFDVMRKTGDKEELVHSFYGTMGSSYLNSGEYILNKNEGKLYNLKTGEEKTLIGFIMSPELMQVSPDGRYLVVLGTVNSMIDYQVHIFDLETGEYNKYVDKNYSAHSNLAFIDNTTAVYIAIDPNQGYEYVVLNTAKEG